MGRSNRAGRTTIGAALVLFMLGVSGCSGRQADKAGGQHPAKPLVLTLANETAVSWELQSFVDEVARRSHGAIRIELENEWRAGRRNVEPGIIRDVKTGKTDMGWVGTRAWDRFGITSFDALHVPFLIDSYALEQAVLQSSIPDEMLKSLDSLGLVGIGVLPGGLRKPIGVAKPLVRPADFRGLRIGTSEARAARATFRELGATPVTLEAGGALQRLDGIEIHIAFFDRNRWDLQAKYVTANVDLWPRPLVLFMSKEALSALTPSQRDLLQTAARSAIPATIATIQQQDRDSVAALCQRGRAHFVNATATDRSQLRAAVAPVYAHLDARTRAYVASIKQIRRQIADRTASPPQCSTRTSTTAGVIPNGTYESTMTRADAHRARIPAADPLYGQLPIRHRLVLRRGDFVLHDTFPDGHTESTMEGTYTTYRGKIAFTTVGENLPPFAWSFDGHTLRFTDLPFHGTGYYGATFSPRWTKTA